MTFAFLVPCAFAGLVELLWFSAGGAGLKLLGLNGGRGPMSDRRKAVATPRFGGLVSGGPAVVPVVAFWGCWVGAGSVLAMGFAGGEVLLKERG